MKKALTTFATVFALVTTAGMSVAGPLCSQLQCGSDSFGDRHVTTNSDDQQYDTDFYLGEVAGGDMFGSVEFGTSHATSNVSTRLAGAGFSVDSHDITLGALWVADSALYIDGQLRYGQFDSTVSLNGRHAVDLNGSGYEISVEMGKPVALRNDLTLIPQVELMYSDVTMGDVADRIGNGRIGSLPDSDALMARVGLRAESTFADNSMLYGQIDVYHAFDDEAAMVSGENSATLSIGGNLALSDHSQLYAEITNESGLGDSSGDHSFSWNIGFAVQF